MVYCINHKMIYAPMGRMISHLWCGDIRFACDIFALQIFRKLSLVPLRSIKEFINRSVSDPQYFPSGKYIIHHIEDISYPQSGYIIIMVFVRSTINHNLSSCKCGCFSAIIKCGNENESDIHHHSVRGDSVQAFVLHQLCIE